MNMKIAKRMIMMMMVPKKIRKNVMTNFLDVAKILNFQHTGHKERDAVSTQNLDVVQTISVLLMDQRKKVVVVKALNLDVALTIKQPGEDREEQVVDVYTLNTVAVRYTIK